MYSIVYQSKIEDIITSSDYSGFECLAHHTNPGKTSGITVKSKKTGRYSSFVVAAAKNCPMLRGLSCDEGFFHRFVL